MTVHQKLRQLSVKHLAKLLIQYHPQTNYYDCDCDDYYTFIKLDGNESDIRCMDEEQAIVECINYLNTQYK